MVSILASEFVAAISVILAHLGVTETAEARHMVGTVLRSCSNHTHEAEDSFVSERVMIIMALLRVDKEGFILPDIGACVKIIHEARESMNARYTAEREARLAEFRARIAARKQAANATVV
jgi:hypothetical protein